MNQYSSLREMDPRGFLQAVAAVGFTGLNVFDFNMAPLAEMFGSLERYRAFLAERGIEQIAGIFHAPAYLDLSIGAPQLPESHDRLFERCRRVVEAAEPLGAENLIVMPAASYRYVEPVTDEKIAIMGEFWNRVGEMTLAHGIKTAAHHEFWCGIQSREEVEKFYAATDPRYVFFCVDTAHHAIAGDDPVDLYRRYADRVSALHFKDTHNRDTNGEYRLPPDAEMIAPSVKRWFWEMGTPQGPCRLRSRHARPRRHPLPRLDHRRTRQSRRRRRPLLRKHRHRNVVRPQHPPEDLHLRGTGPSATRRGRPRLASLRPAPPAPSRPGRAHSPGRT